MRLGSVLALALRPTRAAGPMRVTGARAFAGIGLEGDVHADARSPRQLLLADAAVYRDLALPAHALGENLLLDVDPATLPSGTVLAIGHEVRLRLMFGCEACGQLDRVRPGLARAVDGRRGVLTRVEHGGMLAPGDVVVVVDTIAPAWSDDWRERVARVLEAVPPGHVLEYRLLARLAGIQASYCRAFPHLLARLGPAYADKAVTAQSSDLRPRWHGGGLFDRA